jgi:hypothetical protein
MIELHVQFPCFAAAAADDDDDSVLSSTADDVSGSCV